MYMESELVLLVLTSPDCLPHASHCRSGGDGNLASLYYGYTSNATAEARYLPELFAHQVEFQSRSSDV